MYYVYEWYVKDTNEVFYVGKGCNNRYKNYWDRNEIFKEYYNKNECSSRIIREFENEKDAFDFEKQYIDELKSKNECRANIHIGGAGGCGKYWSEELRKDYSENNVMKRPEQRKRMSINNPMKNPEIAKRVKKQKSKKVIINNVEYESIKDVMNKYNTTWESINNWCLKGINPLGERCRFANEEQHELIGRYNKGGCKSIKYKGITYEAVIDLCREINKSETAVHSWLKRGFDTEGNECRYIDDERTNLVFENRHAKRNKNKAKKIIINGVLYQSVADASKLLNIPKSTIYSYLQGKKHNPNIICAYDNQQPSQENVA